MNETTRRNLKTQEEEYFHWHTQEALRRLREKTDSQPALETRLTGAIEKIVQDAGSAESQSRSILGEILFRLFGHRQEAIKKG